MGCVTLDFGARPNCPRGECCRCDGGHSPALLTDVGFPDSIETSKGTAQAEPGPHERKPRMFSTISLKAKIPTLTTIIEGWDAWGKRHARRVTWMPARIEDDCMENIGWAYTAWSTVDEPPIYACPGQFGHVAFRRHVLSGGCCEGIVADPFRVESLDDLAPGCFFMEEIETEEIE